MGHYDDYNIIIAGGRDFRPNEKHKEWLINILTRYMHKKNINVVCGMAKGADTFGLEVAEELGILVLKYPANWKYHGKAAGYIRNVEMAKISDMCILFPGGRGTMHMKKIAKECGLKIIEYIG